MRDRDPHLRHVLVEKILGVLDALKVIQAIVPSCKINTVGYCIGGTLLAIAAAYLAREADAVIHSITLLAAQTDFTEAGELTLFIDNSQLDVLENMMWDQGYLDTKRRRMGHAIDDQQLTDAAAETLLEGHAS